MGEVNIAIIGMGKMGILHASILRNIEGTKIKALIDKDKKLGNFAKSIGLDFPFYTDLNKALQEQRINTIFLCTPPGVYIGLLPVCLSHNCNIFMEKPMGTTYEQSLDISNLVKNSNVKSCVGFMMAHYSTFKRAKEIFDSGILGRIDSFYSTAYISQVFRNLKGWQYDQKLSGGGVLISMASHLLFLIDWYFGKPLRVRGESESFYTKIDDSFKGEFLFNNGIRGSLETSWSIEDYPNLSVCLNIKGSNGKLEVSQENVKLKLKGKREQIEYKTDLEDSEFELGGEGYYNQDKKFCESIISGEEYPINVQKGLEVQAMIHTLYASDKSKKWEEVDYG